jgi:hypothetical protein
MPGPRHPSPPPHHHPIVTAGAPPSDSGLTVPGQVPGDRRTYPAGPARASSRTGTGTPRARPSRSHRSIPSIPARRARVITSLAGGLHRGQQRGRGHDRLVRGPPGVGRQEQRGSAQQHPPPTPGAGHDDQRGHHRDGEDEPSHGCRCPSRPCRCAGTPCAVAQCVRFRIPFSRTGNHRSRPPRHHPVQ